MDPQAGEAIAGTAVRRLIRSDQTDGRFSVLTGELPPRSLIVPHTHAREDEVSFVRRGRIGARVGDRDISVDCGGVLFRPAGVPHALWNPTDEPAITVEFISPGGLEKFFEDLGRMRMSGELSRADLIELSDRYDTSFHPEMIPELVNAYSVRPGPPWIGADLRD